MKVSLRVLIAFACGATAAIGSLAAPAQALAPTTSASQRSDHVEITHSCSQAVEVGHYGCFAERRADLGFASKRAIAASREDTPPGYGPSDLQSAYNLPSSSAGTGQRVYVVDAYDDPDAESDLSAYRSQYGLAACTTSNGCFQKLNQNGAASPLPAPNTGWAGEISLDLDMVSATCPRCGISLIEAKNDSDNLFTAVKEATTLGAKFVAISWGGPETGTESTYDSTYLKPTGVVYAAATGDDAYQAGVSYPASSVDAVAVGGTTLENAADARGWTESVWGTSRTDGTGSGCSSDEPRPGWQAGPVGSACSHRAAADVSADADPATGVAVYQTYGGRGWGVYGGTSAAAPIIAATFALAGTPASSDRPASFLYAHAGNLNDVITGSNGSCSPTLLCTAAAGWDGPTGLGTPNGTAAFSSGGSSTTPPTTACAPPFPDVPADNPFCGDIAWLKTNNITNGNTNGTFGPATSISREAMAAFLYRYANPTTAAQACTTEPFRDVPTDNPFCGDIAWLKADNITNGNTNGTFGPATSISREAMAAFLYRYANPTTAAQACTTEPFRDVPTDNPFCGDIAWLKADNITNGNTNGTFGPATSISREAMAAFLHRYSEQAPRP